MQVEVAMTEGSLRRYFGGRGDYSVTGNNCATFCEDVLEAGGEDLDVSMVNSPTDVMQELQDRADFSVGYTGEEIPEAGKQKPRHKVWEFLGEVLGGFVRQ